MSRPAGDSGNDILTSAVLLIDWSRDSRLPADFVEFGFPYSSAIMAFCFEDKLLCISSVSHIEKMKKERPANWWE